jgi:hypothetical protein
MQLLARKIRASERANLESSAQLGESNDERQDVLAAPPGINDADAAIPVAKSTQSPTPAESNPIEGQVLVSQGKAVSPAANLRSDEQPVALPVRSGASVTLNVAGGTEVETVSASSTAVPIKRQFVELPQPADQNSLAAQEWKTAVGISRLGGWYYFDDQRNVDEVNLAFYDTLEGRLHNESCNSDEGLRLVSGFSRLRKLSLYRGQATDESLAAIANLKDLEIISCWNAQQVSDQGIQHLAALTNLREVYFDVGRLGDGALAVFGKLPKLEVLRMLIGNEVTDSGLQSLSGATQLKELAIGQGNHPITDAGVEHLVKLTALENLNLQDSRISPVGVSKLLAKPRLQFLRVNANEAYQRSDVAWTQVQPQ